jgi:hypothetical protein
MGFRLKWGDVAISQFEAIRSAVATAQQQTRAKSRKLKPSKQEGLLKQLLKCLALLSENPRHPGLRTHQYHDMKSPYDGKVFEAYVQNRIPGAYRVFWCYGPEKEQITILAITPHP